MMNSIIWPVEYLPGQTDNFVSNEVIISGLNSLDVWVYLETATLWPSYYKNSADVVLNNAQDHLSLGTEFFFKTFGFPVNAEVVEFIQPQQNIAGRIAWYGWSGEGDTRLDVHHAWLIEDLSHNRVRVLTQETQIGQPAKELAKTRPNPMLNGHQEWLDGLIEIASTHSKG
ncbi:SRPBCC domain-containing protein [Acinetobacter boissieri]|uniref:Polyketide cyclase / dehydrase and lipid transport n=1 Tax=Acinetobacter boissieri TaxID=1219383 RepID=A0A1G6I2S3_9GAMM|nr:SRPBCC domain-containing protein [Acinetobacter boissieri]SDC00839.1 hypothetical protein SAMN05421733_107189 [Acinetobacter boissieri]